MRDEPSLHQLPARVGAFLDYPITRPSLVPRHFALFHGFVAVLALDWSVLAARLVFALIASQQLHRATLV
jgi:hypothetical protein